MLLYKTARSLQLVTKDRLEAVALNRALVPPRVPSFRRTRHAYLCLWYAFCHKAAAHCLRMRTLALGRACTCMACLRVWLFCVRFT